MVSALAQRSIRFFESLVPLSTTHPRFLIGSLINCFSIVPNRFYATLNNPALNDREIRKFLDTTRIDVVPALSASLVFYLTRNDSLYQSLKICLFQSEAVSKVALPFLDKIAASIPAPLKQSRIVFLAPVIVKCFQIAIVKFDLEKNHSIFSTLYTGADQFAKGLGFLWNLRFSILSVGMSDNPTILLIKETVLLVINKQIMPLVEQKMFEYENSCYFPIVEMMPNSLFKFLPHPWNKSPVFNWALGSGLTNIYDALIGSSYDLQSLKNLYKGASENDIEYARIYGKIDSYMASQIP